MPDIVFDSDFVTATAISPLFYSAPIPGVSTQYMVSQDFCQKFENFTPITIGTVHPSLPTYYLAEESPLENIGGGISRWRRTYTQVPATHSEYSTLSYQFIGFLGTYGPEITAVTGRERFTKSVICRIAHDYYLTGVAPYTTPEDIPIIEDQRYKFLTIETDYLGDAPPMIVATVPTLTDYQAMVTDEDEIVAAQSSFERWIGKIYVRKTPYVVAQ